MKILCVLGQHNYGDPARGEGYEYTNFLPALRRLGHEVVFFESFSRDHYRDFADLNRQFLEAVQAEAPDVILCVLLSYEIWLETLELIRSGSNAILINWSTDDSWKYEQFSRFIAPPFHVFGHKDYHPLEWDDIISDKIYIARMVPNRQETNAEAHHPEIAVSHARVRYSVKATTEADVGSAVKTFEVANTGNQPCHNRPPCSPDGKWKAAIGSMSLDAGERNQFRNARVSCIAGPCPFANVELEDLSGDGRYFNVQVRNWSDTATFLLEAEVVHPMVSDIVRSTS